MAISILGREFILKPKHGHIGVGTRLLMGGESREDYSRRRAAEERRARECELNDLVWIAGWYVEMLQANPWAWELYAETVKAVNHVHWAIRFRRPTWRRELAEVRHRYFCESLAVTRQAAAGLKSAVSAKRPRGVRPEKQAAYDRMQAEVDAIGAGAPEMPRPMVLRLAAKRCNVHPKTIERRVTLPRK